ncbi:DUF3006 domain-containing protein [Hathewaya limosa]|uniref:Uncharacterized protein (UPF0371 family) n=1 Tax=Hathewaya limosa TaxID=1536 RepID=A0ABU0JNU2_HATLI|nr:DUF3006 domain-containing protein [Hathewaya limosa]AWZ49720.1 DUF3006 domain-containing protein [Clostridiaceae bacterium 14S0207]MDQ0478709.1 uncharacterized protein (UPF0371 family) [Hathewaya limosa]
MKGIIDRFEGEFAIIELEDRNIITLKKSELPKDAKEQMVINIINKEIFIDKDETLKKQKEIEKLLEDLWR